MNITVIFRVNPLWKDLQLRAYFSLAFYEKKLKNHKIQFLVTKRGQKSYQICFVDLRPRNCGWFHLLFSTHNHFIKPKTEKRKIPFLVTKSNQKFNLTNFPDLGPPNSWLVNIILIENDF